MFKQLLVPLDGSFTAERAIPVAARLARASDGTIILLHVAGLHIEAGPYLGQGSIYSQSLVKSEAASAYHYLERLAHSKELAGIKVLIEVLSGIPTQTILRAVQFYHVDLIVLCSYGFTGIKRWLHGSVSHELMRASPVPILVLREGWNAHMPSPAEITCPFRVIVFLDNSSFSQDAIAPGIQLASAFNALPTQSVLHIIRVIRPPSLHEIREYEQCSLDVDLQEEAFNEARSALRTIADAAASQMNAEHKLRITWSVEEGKDVIDALLNQAEPDEKSDAHLGCDVIALAAHGREGFQGWKERGVAERLLDSTKLPLLIVPALDGYVLRQRKLA